MDVCFIQSGGTIDKDYPKCVHTQSPLVTLASALSVWFDVFEFLPKTPFFVRAWIYLWMLIHKCVLQIGNRTTHGYAFEFGEPGSRRIISRVNHSLRPDFVTVMQKDSTEITDADRDQLRMCIQSSNHVRMIITHGTDTLVSLLGNLGDKP
eukprot:1131460-Prorocentrum_minimum.AAC.3